MQVRRPKGVSGERVAFVSRAAACNHYWNKTENNQYYDCFFVVGYFVEGKLYSEHGKAIIERTMTLYGKLVNGDFIDGRKYHESGGVFLFLERSS